MNDNQNHNVREGRTTSRVLAPPGGRSTVTLGLGPAPAPVKQAAKKEQVQNDTKIEKQEEGVPPPPSLPGTSTAPLAAGPLGVRTTTDKPVSANAFAAASNMNGAQVMTGRPTSRVLHPGGGGGPTQWKLG